MQVHDGFDNGQPEAEAAGLMGMDARKLLDGNALAVITPRAQYRRAYLAHRQVDVAARRCVAGGVIHEVGYDAARHLRIAVSASGATHEDSEAVLGGRLGLIFDDRDSLAAAVRSPRDSASDAGTMKFWRSSTPCFVLTTRPQLLRRLR